MRTAIRRNIILGMIEKKEYRITALEPISADPEMVISRSMDDEIRKRMSDVIETEAPIREALLFKRVINSISMKKVGSRIEPVFKATGGLTLAQVREITGLETTTIQNWVKRGWVMKPENKRYKERHVIRIILINSIRGSIQIEKIIRLMEYINGDVEDTSDDLVPDSTLFNLFFKTVWLCQRDNLNSEEEMLGAIENETQGIDYLNSEGKERLSKALLIMTLAYQSAVMRQKAERIINNLL